MLYIKASLIKLSYLLGYAVMHWVIDLLALIGSK
jgi:hypothetical protein